MAKETNKAEVVKTKLHTVTGPEESKLLYTQGKAIQSYADANLQWDTAPATSDPAYLPDEREGFRIDCHKGASYHGDRMRHCRYILMIVSTVLIVVSVFAFVNGFGWLLAIIAFSGAINLAIDLGGQALMHRSLRDRFYDLLKQAEDTSGCLEKLKQQKARMYRESQVRQAFNIIAYNAAMDINGRARKSQFEIGTYARIFRDRWPSIRHRKIR